MIIIVPGPLFTHECPRCQYLGSVRIDTPAQADRSPYDLYYCPSQMIGGATVVARYGNEGKEYMSGLPKSKQFRATYPEFPTNIAFARALEQHYITEEQLEEYS